VAKASVQVAEVALDNTYVRAPFDGTVISKNADVGEIVAPMAGSINARGTVVTIADMTSLEVEPDVAESNIEKVAPGEPCIITLDAYPGVQYEGYVSKIIPTANRSKGTVTVKVKFKKYDSRVLPEMSAKVLFLKGGKKLSASSARPELAIPRSAVVTRGDKQIVFRIKNGRAIETEVSIGRQLGKYVEVKSGLSDGERVVDSPSGQVKNGVKVKVEK
jgi:RND family efflux transporter MFP subunit